MTDLSPQAGRGGQPGWTVVWQGDPIAAATAMAMLEEHGLDVRKEDGLTTRLFVHPEDEATVHELFVDWQM